ncbi:MAG TPA: heat-inducible transcriptional repressor HrcA [Vicinamibacterales bacterium]|nr:heat-inducible transcriptional repressor HrcA [Vicinamibacterales bacterium]
MTRHPELPERDRRILSALVQAYIEHGEPVSSLWLASRGFGVSSATLRNILARLEEQGYVHQPHTSAGRVPTDLGYRLYVDQLLSDRRVARPAPLVEERLRKAGTIDEILSHASHEISRASHQIGFAIGASVESTIFEHLEFVPLDAGKVLVVLVSTRGITHKVVDPAEVYSGTELHEAANYLTTEFKGCSLAAVRAQIVERLQAEQTLYDALMARAFRLASSTFEALDPQPAIYIQGTSLLFELGSGEDPATALATMKTLVRMMEEKMRLVQLLDDISGAGLTVVIGSELVDPELQHFSLVTSRYARGGRIGAVGVIGPTRMRYLRAINIVDSLSRAIDRVFETT